ncbi:MAG: hypothetical protein Q8P67_23450 [archaeon]|nr:hypothetical protein [archaeon]
MLDGIWSSGLPQLETPFNLQFDPLTCQASLVAKAPVNALHFHDWHQLSWKGPLVRTGDHFDLGSSCQDEPSFSMQFTQRHTLIRKGLWEALVGGSDPDFYPIDHTFKMVLSDFGDPVTNSTPPVVKISGPEWSWMYERTSSSSSSSSLQICGLALLSSQAPSLAEPHLPFFYATPPERLRRYYQTFSLDQLRAALSLLGQEPSSDLDAEQLILAIQDAPLHLGPFLIIRIVELHADLIKILIPDNTLWLVSGRLSSFNHSEPSDLLLLTEFFSAVVCALKTLPRVSHLLDTLPTSALHFA